MKDTITVNFILPDGKIYPVEANPGESLLQVAHLHNLPLEGACGGSLACSTCHVILDEKWFNDTDISDDENDMLDLAWGLQKTSRLGCQIILNKSMDGLTVRIPQDSFNFSGETSGEVCESTSECSHGCCSGCFGRCSGK